VDEMTIPVSGMTISVRSRRDVVIVDPDQFLAAARRAYRDVHPDVSEEGAAESIVDAVDATYALLERFGQLLPDDPAGMIMMPSRGRTSQAEGSLPGKDGQDAERTDGLSPAGWRTQVVLNETVTLQDYGCFGPEDPFALPDGSQPDK
jgi:hypothetical protein